MKTLATTFRKSTFPVHRPRLRAGLPLRPIQGEQRDEIRRILDHPAAQPKLAVGPVGDKHEREADQVANRVMRKPEDSDNEKEESEG